MVLEEANDVINSFSSKISSHLPIQCLDYKPCTQNLQLNEMKIEFSLSVLIHLTTDF